nr:biotin/lipoyl-binding protein [Paenibacillus baekrokdamisoli]
MELTEVPKDRKRKRKIQIIFTVFMGLLVLFTLFSNTLQSLTLPKVTTERAAMGSFVHTLEGSGVLRPIVEAKLLNPAGWKIKTILVKEGDHVKKGQRLIIYDSKSAERELQDEKTQLAKQTIDLQSIQDRFILSKMEGDETKIRSVSRDMETRKLDMGVQERKISDLRDRLTNQKEITAPFDGLITKLNAVEGLSSMGEPDVYISSNSGGYLFEFPSDAQRLTDLGVQVGEKIEVEVHMMLDQQTRIIEGIITEIVNAEPRTENSNDIETNKTLVISQKVIRVKVVGTELKGGEQALVKLTKSSQQDGFIISNKAIHQDREGKYIYKIEEQQGALGNVFVARKVTILSSESNDKETIVQAVSFNESDLIILESSEPLQDGNRVRLQ